MAVSLSWSTSVSYPSDTTATISVTLKAKSTNGSYNLTSSSYGYISIDGGKVGGNFGHKINKNTTTTLGTKSKTVSRTTGARSVSIYAWWHTDVSSGNISKSGSVSVAARPVYTVYFHNGYSGYHSSVGVYAGYTTTFPYISRTGYNFGSWSGYAQGAATPAITSTCTYTASWSIINYSISYALNGGSWDPNNPNGTHPTSYNITTIPGIDIAIPRREGYYFTGWTGSNGSTPQRSVKILTGSTGNRSYTANWRLNVYKVKLNLNDSQEYPAILPPGISDELPKTHNVNLDLPIPARTTFTFAGWSYNSNNIGVICSLNGENDGDTINLEATWSKSARPIILHRFGSATDNSNTSEIYKVVNAPLTALPRPNVNNYQFVKWTDSNGNTVTEIQNDEFIAVVNPDPAANPQLNGWYEKVGDIYEASDDQTVEDKTYYEFVITPIHLYADWIKQYIIRYNPNTPSYNDGIQVTGTIAPVVVVDGQEKELTFSGYTYVDSDNQTKCIFRGWSENSTAENPTYTSSGDHTLTLRNHEPGYVHNLYAVWAPVEFAQTFSTSGQESPLPTLVKYYSNLTFPDSPWQDITDRHLIAWEIYDEIKEPSGSPVEQNWYELDGSTYVLTTDEVVEIGKQYYIYNTYNIGALRRVTQADEFNAIWAANYKPASITNITVKRQTGQANDASVHESEYGRYVLIDISGIGGQYARGDATVIYSQSYSITGEFYDETGGLISTVNGDYIITDEQGHTFNVNKIFSDTKLKFTSCKLTITDTHDYGFEVSEFDRQQVHIVTIPLVKPIAFHIADDLSAISVFKEFEEGQKGLIVNNNAYVTDTLTAARGVNVESVQVGVEGGAWQWRIDPTSKNLFLKWVGGV